MAIKISNSTIIDDSRNIINASNANITGVTTLGTVRISSGIVTATTGIVTYYGEYYGTFNGTINSLVTINYADVSGIATYAQTAGIATNAQNATYAQTAGIATVAQGLTGTPNIVVGIVTATEYYGVFKGTIDTGVIPDRANYADVAGVATNVIGGIASVTSLNVTGVTTLGTVRISSGIISATSGVVTYYGDGSQLQGVTAFYVATQVNTSNPVYPTLASGVGVNSVGISTNKLVFVESTSRFGINTSNPQYNLHVVGDFAATSKSFVIDHPTKEGKKLRYASLEGPENGVYVRGRTKDSVIELPEYWTKLVDKNSITINLTPIGHSALPRVESIDNTGVKVFSKEEGNLDYYYTIYAERKDIEKLVVEY